MERKVGEIFEIDGVYYRVEIETWACKGCCLRGTLCEKSKSIRGECQSATRKEHGVVFVKIENMEERTITLTLEKAREFYEKGDEFRDLALSAFTEEELTKKELPKTWEEFCCLYPIKKEEYYIGSTSSIKQLLNNTNYAGNVARNSLNYNLLPSKEAAEAHLALIKLHQLRDCYRQGWKPELGKTCFCIIRYRDGDIKIVDYGNTSIFLSFQTEKLAKEFLNNFEDLIKQAGDLI